MSFLKRLYLSVVANGPRIVAKAFFLAKERQTKQTDKGVVFYKSLLGDDVGIMAHREALVHQCQNWDLVLIGVHVRQPEGWLNTLRMYSPAGRDGIRTVPVRILSHPRRGAPWIKKV